MYEVCKHFEREYDLTHFLSTTRNFGKRFYVVEGNHRKDHKGEEWLMLHITAIGISRDLTYIFKINIRCDDHSTTLDENKTEERPMFGWIPRNEKIKKLYFPCLDEESYCDVFKYSGFHEVGSIRKDNLDLTA